MRDILEPWSIPLTNAAIVGWVKCLPPAILTNSDLATFLPTHDEWIRTGTGMRERRISHVPGIVLAITATRRAVACAGLRARKSSSSWGIGRITPLNIE
jgi:3-oxoacyl-[acyl-carrier-protein] synthase-3